MKSYNLFRERNVVGGGSAYEFPKTFFDVNWVLDVSFLKTLILFGALDG